MRGTLVRLVALRQLRARPGRALLAVGGIALGVALLLAMQLINRAAIVALRQTIEGAAGRAALQVVAPSDAGMPEDVLARVRAFPDVAVAVAVVEGPALVDDGRGESLAVFGVDLGDADALRAYEGIGAEAEAVIDDPLVFLAQPDSVVVTKAFASARGLDLGDRVRVVAAAGRRTLTIRGLLEPRGLSRVLGSSLAIMDVFAAQRLFVKEGRYDRVDVVLAGGTGAQTATAVLARMLPAGLAIERPERRGERVEAMLRAAQAMLTSMSSIALVVAVFIIYNSFATVVVERRREIGMLRALGARRRQIVALWLAEALCDGALGVLGGVALGLGLAHLLVDTVARSTAIAFALPALHYRIALDAGALALSAGMGLAAALLAGLLPALTAARVGPLEAIRHLVPIAPRRWGARALAAGLAFAVLAAVCLVAVRPGAVSAGYLANVSLGITVAFLSVPAVLLSTRVVRPLGARVFGVSGQLAAESSRRMPLRTATTVAALALALALSAGMAVLNRSFAVSVDAWARSWAEQDLYVRAAFRERGFIQAPLPETLAEELRSVAGVARVERFRLIRQRYGSDEIVVTAGSTNALAGRSIWVSDTFAFRYGTRIGDRVRLATVRGPRRFRVADVRRDYNSDRGSVTVALATLRRLWGDRRVTDLGVVLAPGTAPDQLRADLLRRFGPRYGIQVLDPQAVRADIMRGVSRAFSFTRGLEAVTLLVAFAGILDTVLAGVLARRREIGILRAIGCLRRDVARAFALEGLLIGGLGAVLGLTAGVLLSLAQILVVFPNAVGYVADLHVPAGRLAAVAGTALLLAVAAAAVPAHRAAHLRVTETLTHE
jgi:putative ABC transport system permease protein